MIPKIYIDIDGVLLDKGQKITESAADFIKFLVENFDCYWLTTHCRSGVNKAVNYLAPFYDKPTIDLLETIKPTDWDTLKTEAIDFDSNFYRLEDYPFESEINILKQNHKLSSLIKVNLNNAQELKRVREILDI